MPDTPTLMRDAVAPLENRLAEMHQKLDSSEGWRAETTKILARLSTIVVGDDTIGHVGLLRHSQEHSAYIAEQQTKQAELRGGRKMLVFLSAIAGAIASKGLDGIITFLTTKGH